MSALAITVDEASAWDSLVPSLADLPDDACRAIASRLDRWPDADRTVPAAWIDRAVDGDPPPALSLCRSLELARTPHEENIGALLGLPGLAGITRLSLGCAARELTAEWFTGLTALQELRIATDEAFTSAVRDDQLAILAGASLPALTLLSLDMVHLRGPGVAALARAAGLPALTTLELYAPASAAVCTALASRPAPALRRVRRLALCADKFTVAAAANLSRADDLLAGLEELELRIDESGGFDWAEPFTGTSGARNISRFTAALDYLLPALRSCSRVTIDHRPAGQVVHLGRADIDRLAGDRRALRAAFPPRLAGAR